MRHHGQDPGYITSFNLPMIQFEGGRLATASFKWIFPSLEAGISLIKLVVYLDVTLNPVHWVVPNSGLVCIQHHDTTTPHIQTSDICTTSKWLQGSKFIPCVVNLCSVLTGFRPLLHWFLQSFCYLARLNFILSRSNFSIIIENLKVDIFISVVKL